VTREFLEDECISLITRISCLLAFYDFELSPLYDFEFQNSKKLFYDGLNNDLVTAFCTLYEIEQTLLDDIYDFYKPYWLSHSEPSLNIWEVDA